MPALIRSGWVVALLLGLCSQTNAGPLTASAPTWNLNFGRGMSSANLSTNLPSWPGMGRPSPPIIPTAVPISPSAPTMAAPMQLAPAAPAVTPAASLPAPVPATPAPAPSHTMAAAAPAPVPAHAASDLAAAPLPAAPAPVIIPAPAPIVPAVTAAVAAPAAATTPSYNAFVNLGSAPFPNAANITTGNSQPWAGSTQIGAFFGGQPTAQQQTAFDNTVMQRIQQTFQNSGISINLTDVPGSNAPHTISLVSNTSALINPVAIGMTYIGGNGFSFIDQEAKSSSSLDQLEWIVAHNIAHELMLSFGVGENYDQTGSFIDAKNANWAMMTSSDATFSTAAAQAINQALAAANAPSAINLVAPQVFGAEPVPEPAALLIWSGSALAIVLKLRRRPGGR